MTGNWRVLVNQPSFPTDTMLLLTDGSVFCHEESSPNWYRLIPDVYGSYQNGRWVAAAPLPPNAIIPIAKGGPLNAPLYFASAVLRDGTVFVAGGEYNRGIANADILATQIYDPATDSWTLLRPPPGWTAIGDAPSCVLPDGRLLLGSINTTNTAIFDPSSRSFTIIGGKNDVSSEETWTLISDGTVVTAECSAHSRAEKFVAATEQWVSAGTTASDLVESTSIEIGPAILLPDGRLFAIGATGHTGLYTKPAMSTQPGVWSDGPTFPLENNQQLIAKDAPAALLPNGHVLCAVGPAGGCAAGYAGYCPPTYFFEYDPTAPVPNSLTRAPSPTSLGQTDAPYIGRMLLLPTGQVLFGCGKRNLQIYTPDGAPDPAWAPRITACATWLRRGKTYTLSGVQINGRSQAVSYGDDAQMATNYPLVRVRDFLSGNVSYCRTHNHSTMGVATGATQQSTEVTIAWSVRMGRCQLAIVANGIASVSVDVRAFFRWPGFQAMDATTIFVLHTDGTLRLDHGPFITGVLPVNEQFESNVIAFQAIDTATVFVLRSDDTLRLDHGPFVTGVLPVNEQFESNAMAFQAMDATTIFVLHTDGTLRLDHGPFITGVLPVNEQFESNVIAFQAIDTATVFVLRSDDTLRLDHGPFVTGVLPVNEQFESNVMAFQAIDANTVFVLRTDGTLRLDHGPFVSGVMPVNEQFESNVMAFQAIDANTVFVLRTDGTLRLDHGPFVSGVMPVNEQFESNVMAFQAIDANTVFVLHTDGTLRLDHGPFVSGVMPVNELFESKVASFQS